MYAGDMGKKERMAEGKREATKKLYMEMPIGKKKE